MESNSALQSYTCNWKTVLFLLGKVRTYQAFRIYQVQYVSCLLPHNTTFFRRCYIFSMPLVSIVMRLISYHILTLPKWPLFHTLVCKYYIFIMYTKCSMCLVCYHIISIFHRGYTYTMYISLACRTVKYSHVSYLLSCTYTSGKYLVLPLTWL